MNATYERHTKHNHCVTLLYNARLHTNSLAIRNTAAVTWDSQIKITAPSTPPNHSILALSSCSRPVTSLPLLQEV